MSNEISIQPTKQVFSTSDIVRVYDTRISELLPSNQDYDYFNRSNSNNGLPIENLDTSLSTQ